MDPARSPLRELERDRRRAAVIGRHARLELTFGYRSGRTVLTHAYAEPPFRIGRCFDIDGAAYLILVSSAPGVFGGDSLVQRVTVERGARVLLASQAALQVHPPVADTLAAVHYDYRVEDGGELHCHWDPVIPFAGARLEQRISLAVAPGSRVYWSDALMSGRVSRGESWRFASIDHELRFVAGGALQYLERYVVSPEDRQPTQAWRWGAGNYAGTTLVYHDAATAWVAEQCHRQLAGIPGVAAGVDLLEPRVMLARFLAGGGAAFGKARSAFRDLVLEAVFDSPRLVARR